MSSASIFARKWAGKFAHHLHSALSLVVFIILDLLEALFCIIFKHLDEYIEGKASSCYCRNTHDVVCDGDQESELSETLYGREKFYRKMGFIGKWEGCKRTGGDGGSGGGVVLNRWSDCGCESCISWTKNIDGGTKLHFVVKEPSSPENSTQRCSEKPTENVIFLHGFLCSSSIWTESVFRNLSESAKHDYRLFAIDLLGFGKSPKPMDCQYTLRDHLEMIENSVINPFGLKSFHVVAHSMGCLIAIALAARHIKSIKSVTLVAPPYFPCCEDGEPSLQVLKALAGKKLWPPEAFHSAFMSWYEHLGRLFCLLVCRNHRTWEAILKLLYKNRHLHFAIQDLAKHTHHSAWHNMHNVICGGAKLMDGYLEILKESKVKISIIHGDRDSTAPLECSYNLKKKVTEAEVTVVENGTHRSVLLRRNKDFTECLERIWASVC